MKATAATPPETTCPTSPAGSGEAAPSRAASSQRHKRRRDPATPKPAMTAAMRNRACAAASVTELAPVAHVASRNGEGVPAVERVNKAGAIRIENEGTLRVVPLYYYAERSQWFSADGQGGFTKLSDSQAKVFIAEYGFNKNAKDSVGNTPAERALHWLMQNNRVAYAGPLAGYRAGLHKSGGFRFLVTESPVMVEPQPGKCPTIRTLVESLFFEADADDQRRQQVAFYLWASESFAAFYARAGEGEAAKFRHCPALAIFGPKRCGKSALIDLVLTPLFGQRKADPVTFLRERKFNKDLFPASLLVMDDSGAGAGLAERRQRGESIKKLIWNEEQRMEGKGVDALHLRPFWRLVIAGNDDEAGLQVCPALAPSLEDKLLILSAAPAEGLPTTTEENDAWAERIRAELPAFAAYLLAWRPPRGVALDERTRVINFWHPRIVSALREMQPEMRLLELIDTFGLIDPQTPCWEGKASEFEQAMRAKDEHRQLDRLFVSSTTAGRMLKELSRLFPERVKHTDRDGRSHYRIFNPK